MKKAELMNLVGKKVRVTFRNGNIKEGILGYVDDFSMKYDYRTPGMFFVNRTSFKISHTKKVEVLE